MRIQGQEHEPDIYDAEDTGQEVLEEHCQPLKEASAEFDVRIFILFISRKVLNFRPMTCIDIYLQSSQSLSVLILVNELNLKENYEFLFYHSRMLILDG